MYIYLIYNICAVISLATLILALITRGLYKGRNNKIFLLLCIVLFFAGILDTATEYLDHFAHVTESDTALRYTLNLLYYLLHNIMSPLYFLYIISIMSLWHKLKESRLIKYLWLVPYNVDIILLIVNVTNHKIFYIDDDLQFGHGPWFMVLYIVAFYYMFFEIWFTVKYRKLLSWKWFWLLLLLLPVNGIAVLVQFFFPEFRIEVFTTTIMFTTIAINVHRPEDMMDDILEMQSYKAFLGAVHSAFAAESPVSYLMIRVNNYRLLRRSLGMRNYTTLIKTIGSRINQIIASINLSLETYYLEQGSFVVAADTSMYGKLLNAGHAINAYLSRPIPLKHMEVKLETGICLVRCPEDIDSETSLLNFEGTYNSKLPVSGRVICLSEIAQDTTFMMKNDMETIISRGIEQHNFRMYYQPIYSVEKGKFATAEALIRLIDPEYGFVSPGVFIPAAEESGAIHDIGDFVFDEVCRFIGEHDLAAMGIEYIEINLSAAQCIESSLYDKIRKFMDRHGVRPDQINLEITETTADYDPVMTDINVNKLAADGISFSLDDYGTGYSNISRVVKLPLDIVKLDKSLVDDMDIPTMWTVIRSTVKMLKRMNKKILVEGVEDKRALDKFTEIGCDYIQGFYFSKPLPEEEFISFVENANTKD